MAVTEIITNQFFLLFLSIFSGLFLGRIRIGRFSFGTSGILLSGLVIGWAAENYLVLPALALKEAPGWALNYAARGAVSEDIFTLSLVLFIAAVGLLASGQSGRVIRKYGPALVILGFLLPLCGAAASFLIGRFAGIKDSFAVSGLFTGALTSSPGLAAALEQASAKGANARASVGYGYALGYAPGVIAVILAVQILPYIARIDKKIERDAALLLLGSSPSESGIQAPAKPSPAKTAGQIKGFIAFSLVCVIGLIIGSIKVGLGSLGTLSLGVTGGVLISALIFGAVGKIGPLSFAEPADVLSARKELGLSFFLAVVGLKYGHITLSNIGGEGFVFLGISFLVALFALAVGFAIGRYVFKLNWILLSGALCGAMTSTPGLGAALDASDCDIVTVGYGAAYPFALFGMILFTVILQTMPF